MITKNYIKMCEKFKKLQEDWQPKEGDRFVYKNDITSGVVIWFDEGEYLHLEDKIYLPTQEQLQEMMINKKDYKDWIDLLEGMWYEFGCNFRHQNLSIYSSFTEVWLALVMYERYHKIWTGEKWVKAEGGNIVKK